jgi:hypothetical protein
VHRGTQKQGNIRWRHVLSPHTQNTFGGFEVRYRFSIIYWGKT